LTSSPADRRGPTVPPTSKPAPRGGSTFRGR
jgi:hypothetical protein